MKHDGEETLYAAIAGIYSRYQSSRDSTTTEDEYTQEMIENVNQSC